jgi:hypothetical protein
MTQQLHNYVSLIKLTSLTDFKSLYLKMCFFEEFVLHQQIIEY